MKQNPISLSKRLRAAAELVRKGAYVADVGTDHAYLPLWLLLEGRIRGGVVSDINEGPLDRASAHLRCYDKKGLLTPVLCDGLSALEPYHPEDVCILGMGGELIARIVEASAYVRQSGIRLILQPMSMADELRKYLTENGFSIVDEAMSHAAGKVYACICAEYAGSAETEPYTEAELLLGRCNIQRGGALFRELAQKETAKLQKRIGGLKSGGYDASAEEKLLTEIEEIIEKHG